MSRFRTACDLYDEGKLSHYGWDNAAEFCENRDIIGFIVQTLSKEEALHLLYLFSLRGDVIEAFDNINKIDLILRYENLKEVFDMLCQLHSWQKLKLPHAKKSKAKIDFDSNVIEWLFEFVGPEYKLLELLRTHSACMNT